MPKNQNPSGVGGWLRFLIIILMVLNPIMGLGSLTRELHDVESQLPQLTTDIHSSNYRHVAWLIFAVLAAISFSAGYRLWKIHFPESVRFAIVALWLSGPLIYLLDLAASILILGLQRSLNELPRMVGKMLLSCVGPGLWTAYLMRSIRVKNTYKMGLNV